MRMGGLLNTGASSAGGKSENNVENQGVTEGHARE
jgi:hypothetical protein